MNDQDKAIRIETIKRSIAEHEVALQRLYEQGQSLPYGSDQRGAKDLQMQNQMAYVDALRKELAELGKP